MFVFCERWHDKTSSFHLLTKEMTLILDDVSCLLLLSIERCLLDYGGPVSIPNVVEMIVELAGVKTYEIKKKESVKKKMKFN